VIDCRVPTEIYCKSVAKIVTDPTAGAIIVSVFLETIQELNI